MTSNSIHDFPFIPVNAIGVAARKPIYSVGINDAPYLVTPVVDGKPLRCPIYRKWVNMLKRVYNPGIQVTYNDCTLCDEWHYFMTFRAWVIQQDWKGKEIDKDLKIPGNKHYSPDNCIFVTKRINTLLSDHRGARGKYPQGVSLHRYNKYRKYIARLNKGPGVRVSIGGYTTPEEASAVYQVAKSNYVREVAMQQDEPLRSILLQWT